MNIGGNLKKINLSGDGKITGDYIEEPSSDDSDGQDHDNQHHQPDYDKVKEQIQNSVGCKVKGIIIVNKVILFNTGSWKFPYFITCIWAYYSNASL
jgi:hypothetical protein